jgi:hypothetical protein
LKRNIDEKVIKRKIGFKTTSSGTDFKTCSLHGSLGNTLIYPVPVYFPTAVLKNLSSRVDMMCALVTDACNYTEQVTDS